MIEIEALRKTFGALVAVDGVTFDVRRGEKNMLHGLEQ